MVTSGNNILHSWFTRGCRYRKTFKI
jgi:hypothetical protein